MIAKQFLRRYHPRGEGAKIWADCRYAGVKKIEPGVPVPICKRYNEVLAPDWDLCLKCRRKEAEVG